MSESLHVFLDQTAFPGDGDTLAERIGGEVIHAQHDVSAVLFHGGTAGGNATVMLIARLPDGRTCVIETTALLFVSAAAAFQGRLERDGELIP